MRYFIAFFIPLVLSSCTWINTSKKHLEIVKPKAEELVLEQSNGYFELTNFELIDSKTTQHGDMKLFGQQVRAQKIHAYDFKGTLRVTQDCEKIVHFPVEPQMFYNLEAIEIDGYTLMGDFKERLFKGDEYEVLLTLNYDELDERTPFSKVRVKENTYERVVDGKLRSEFVGTLRTKIQSPFERNLGDDSLEVD
jgi:hypothetical protein